MDKKRAAVVALLSAVLGAAALMFGAGGASANASDPYCATDGDTGDVTFGVSPLFFVAVDVESPGTPSPGSGFWACVVPPNQGAGVGFRDNDAGAAGNQAESTTCGALSGGGCVTVEDTGAEVDPATTTDAPLSGGTTTGGSAGLGAGTCTYVDGTPDCPFGFTIIAVSVNEADLIPVVTPHTPTPPCTGVNSTCIPVGGSVGFFQDTSNPTVTVQTPTTSPTTVDVAPTGVCLHVEAPSC